MRTSPSKSAPAARQTTGELRQLQRTALAAIRHPLSPAGRTRSRWIDGRPMKQVVAEFIKPNDRLTSLERLEIYNRQYWFRLLDCLWDDYPGLRAILGRRRFEKLRIAYLNQYPSRSFTLRNLGSRLVEFLQEHPKHAGARRKMCLDMARFEWAQVVAFDSEARPPLTVDDLLGKDPAHLRLQLQPHLTLLELDYPLDDFVFAIKKADAAMRSEASNAVEADHGEHRRRHAVLPKAQKMFLAVHRHDNRVYYKRLEPAAFRLLVALDDGASLADACETAIACEDAAGPVGSKVRDWFSTWTSLGWFCRPKRT
jgi:hypothetical protein